MRAAGKGRIAVVTLLVSGPHPLLKEEAVHKHRIHATLLALALAGGAAPTLLVASPASAATGDASVVGRFAKPFEQPGAKCTKDKNGRSACKPAAASVMHLPNGKIYYWDALEGSEDVEFNQVAEYGSAAQNDVSRVLTLGPGDRPSWVTPKLANSGTNPNGNPNADQYPILVDDSNKDNDGDLFCSDQLFLADGRVLDAGGTSYYSEPSVPGTGLGVVELEGLKNARIFDGSNNSWKQTGQMKYGRWYPSLVTQADGKVFVASGVTKLIKPVYADRPTDSGTNVTQTETYDPKTGRWTENPASAKKDLPLYPRLHLLPNGHTYYDAGGQTFNPDGQSYGEALWNLASSYDPVAKKWNDFTNALPQLGNGAVGFRGSAFSQMLPLKAPYNKVDVLSAGGVLGTSPGTYFGSATATVNTITLDGKKETFSSKAVAPMTAPRWYPAGVSLPTGQVIVFNGADRDEVVAPGSGTPNKQPELYDPATNTWTKLASQSNGRTYHNTASLMPDGRVLVAGHAPINTGYAFQTDMLKNAAGFSPASRHPSMEIFSPPNLFYGTRPVITKWNESVARGKTMTFGTTDAGAIGTVTVVRNTATTHLVDGDQRTVELPIVSRTARTVTVAVTGNAAVLPAGPYMLFANKKTAKGLTPSVSRQVFVGTAVPAALAKQVSATNRTRLATELKALPATQAVAPAQATAPVGDLSVADRARPAGAAPTATSLVAGSSPDLTPVALVGRESQRELPVWPVLGMLAAATGWIGVRRLSRR